MKYAEPVYPDALVFCGGLDFPRDADGVRVSFDFFRLVDKWDPERVDVASEGAEAGVSGGWWLGRHFTRPLGYDPSFHTIPRSSAPPPPASQVEVTPSDQYDFRNRLGRFYGLRYAVGAASFCGAPR
jgi:hypothetical protein